MEQASAPLPAPEPGPPPEQKPQQPPLTSLPPPSSSNNSLPSTSSPTIPSSLNHSPNPSNTLNPNTSTPLFQQQTPQQPHLPQSAPPQSQQLKQQEPQFHIQASHIRTPFDRTWLQPPDFSQTNSASSSPVPASAPPPKGVITLGLPAVRPAVTPTRPTKRTSSFSPSSFAAQYGGHAQPPVNVPESTARPAVRGMQNTGIMSPQICPGVVAVHHQQRPVQWSVRPPNSSNSQATIPQKHQGHEPARTSFVGSPSPSAGTSQALPLLTTGSHVQPPLPSSFRPQTSSQSLQQTSHVVQQSHQTIAAAAQQHHLSSQQPHPAFSQQHHAALSPQQHFFSSRLQQQPLPSLNQPQEHSHQLPSPMILQPPNQQLVARVQAVGNQKSFSPVSAQPNNVHANANGRTTVLEGDESGNRILTKRSIQQLVNQIDPSEKLDHEVEDILVDIAEEFIDSITTYGCSLAKHRKSKTLEAKDILLHLERNWNMTLPGFDGDDIKTYTKPVMNDIHKERLADIRKSMVCNGVLSKKSSAAQAAGNVEGHLANTVPHITGS